MKHKTIFFKCYYRVTPGDTNVIPVSPLALVVDVPYRSGHADGLFLLEKPYRYYTDLVTALEKAKAGALVHIDQLIRQGEAGLPELLRYRADHYEDLNINLVRDNIQRVAQQVETDPAFQWHPYRIDSNYDQ